MKCRGQTVRNGEVGGSGGGHEEAGAIEDVEIIFGS